MQVHDPEGHQGSSGGSPMKQEYNGQTRNDTPIDARQKTTVQQSTRLPEPYEFRSPEKVEVDKLNGKYNKAVEFAEKRLAVLNKLATELLDGEEKFLEEEGKLIEKAIVFIDENSIKFKELAEKEVEQKRRLEIVLDARLGEYQIANNKFEEARTKIRDVEGIIKGHAKELVELNKAKEVAAAEIQKTMGDFKKIKMRDPKDMGHELFKWFLAVIYNESQAKYDFENFKVEVLKKDKGEDFIQRLHGFRAFGLGKEEVAQTTKILTTEKEVADRVNYKRKEPMPAVAASFNYIKVIDRVNHLMEEMHKREIDLEAAAKKVDLTGAELDKLRSRKDDAECNLQIGVKAIQTFEAAHRLFQITGQRCKERQNYIAENLPSLKKHQTKSKKTEATVEIQGQENEESTFGGAKKDTRHHQKVRATYESDLQETPPAQKEGCKCTIF
jgi:hypothetical protein